jgi:hypothetical protein
MSLVTIKRKEYAYLEGGYFIAGIVILPMHGNNSTCNLYVAFAHFEEFGTNKYRFVKGNMLIDFIGENMLCRIMDEGEEMDLNEITQIFPHLFR